MSSALKSNKRKSKSRPGKRVQKRVQFSEHVDLVLIPHDKEIWKARVGPWVNAPYHDELWDGSKRCFRDRELTAKEMKRINFDQKVKRAVPSSVFWLYRRYRKRMPTNGLPQYDRRSGATNQVEEERKIYEEKERKVQDDSDIVPEDYIISLEQEDPVDKEKKTIAKSVAKTAKDTKRWSLSKLGVQRKPSFKIGDTEYDMSWLLGGRNEGESNEGYAARQEEAAEQYRAMEFVEEIQRLDGLSRTKVPRSQAVESIWDKVENTVDQFRLLGKSFLWDGQALLQELGLIKPLGEE